MVSGMALLFNPGPTNVAAEVSNALLAPKTNHREYEFTTTLRGLIDGISDLSGGGQRFYCVPFTSSGTGANEAVISTVHGKLLALVAGRYGQRLADIAVRFGVPTVIITFEPFVGIDVAAVRRELLADPSITHLCFAHHETTTSLLAPLRQVCECARERGVVTIVDTISSLFGHDVDLHRDNVDFCTLSANKCLEGVPGVSFVLCRRELMAGLVGQARSFYFDLYAQWRRIYEEGPPPFTMAIEVVFAAAIAVERLRRETVAGRAARYRSLKWRLREGCVRLGFHPLPLPEERTANILQMYHQPASFTYQQLHAAMKQRGFIIYTDAANRDRGIIFFATMGAIGEADVDAFLNAMTEAIQYLTDGRGLHS